MHASLLDVSLLSCMCPPVCTYWTPAGAGVGFRGHHDVVLVMPMMFSVMYFAGISDDDYKDYSLRSKAVTIMNQEFCHAQDKTEQVRYTKQATITAAHAACPKAEYYVSVQAMPSTATLSPGSTGNQAVGMSQHILLSPYMPRCVFNSVIS